MLKSYKKEIIIENIKLIKKRGGKNNIGWHFYSNRIIQKDLPKRKLKKEYLKKLNFGDKFLFPLKINENIPPYNQSSMDGIGVKTKKKNI